MNMPQTCDPDRLDAFVRGELSEHQESELASHLDQCAGCGEELERRVAAADQWREASELLTHRTRRSNVMGIANDPSTNGSFATSTTFAEQMDQVVGMLAPTDDPEMLGRIGGYEVSGVIGCGGMGVVFKAHDRSLDRVVAIKVMAPHLAGSGAARKRFARESKAAAAVLHPNVIAIHCVADDPKLPYLVMPYIGGASLQKRVEADGPLCTQDTLRIGQQIAAGLAAAHAQGLVHRDIKPANILLERGVERVTITDFGLARAVDDATMTRSGVIAGTPQYMSPEQARGELIDHRSDLFSLGSVMYMMCAGHSPFRAETTFGILRRITDNQPRPLREISPDVPEWLCAIIEKLHAKEPSERFQSAEKVSELLESCLAHVQQPAAIPLPEAVAALAPIRDRRPPIGKFIAAAAFAFALVFAGVFIVLELNKGTLTIQSDANDIRVRITHGDEVIDELKVTKYGKSVRVAAGQYKVEIIGETDGLIVENGQLTLHRAGTEVVRIVHQAKTPSERQTLSKDLNADEWLDKLQGNWNVVQHYVDNGVPKRNSYSATVRRNRMEIIPVQVDDGQYSMMFDLVLGEAGPPQQIDLKVVVSDLARQELQQVLRDYEPLPEAVLNPIYNGIVEFEGNTLRICNHEVPNSPRPIQFTDSSDRVIWNFTRSDRDLSVEPSNDGRLLSEAIRQFNGHQKSDPIGSKQLPLTDDEVIAAVRAMRQEIKDLDISESEYRRLLDAIEHRQIPKEWSITSNNQFQLRDGQIGERWVVQLVLRRSDSSTRASVFRSRYVRLVSEDPKSALPIPEGNVSIAQWLAKVNAPDLNIYAPLPDLPVTEQEIVAALADLIDKDQSTEFAPQRKTLQDIIETRSLPKEAEISVSRPKRLRGYVSRWSNREGFENENWRLRFEYPYTQDGKQIITAVHLGFRSISSRPVDYVADDEIHWGPAAQDGLQFGVAIEEVTLHDESDLASAGAMAYTPHFYFRNPSKTDSMSIQFSDMYQHYEIDARTATGEQLPSKRRQGSYRISSMIFPDTLNGESRIYKRACPFVVGNYAQTLFEDSLSLEPADGQSFESFPSLAVNAPRDTPLRIRISIPHPLFADSARLLSAEIRLPSLRLTQTIANTAEDEKAKDEAAKAWLRRPVVGSTHGGKTFELTGHDALLHCVMTNNAEALNRLLTMDKYDLSQTFSVWNWTLLQHALQTNNVETTSLLLRHGANPHVAHKGTPTPLELAERSGSPELVALVKKYLESNPTTSQTNIDVRQIIADIDGEVHEVLIGYNSVVTKGQILLRMRNADLQGELSKTSDQMNEANSELDRIVKKLRDNKDLPIEEVEKAERERSELQKRVLTLSEQITRLNERCKSLVVKSTVAGTIITKDVEQLLKNRPVVAGQVLLEIAIEPSRNITEKTANHAGEDGGVVTIPLKAEWIPEEWLKRNMGRRHLTIVADGIVQDESKSNVVNHVQRGILHDCRLESYEKMSRAGLEYWNARFFVPRKPMYSIGALWFKDAIDTYRIGDRHTPVPSPDLTQDNPQVKLDEAMKEGHVFRLDYVNDDFENNLPMVKSQRAESTSIQENAESLVTITFSGTIDGAAISASGIGWRVDDAGHILLPSHVVPTCDDESIALRYASGEHCSAKRLKTIGHLTLLKSDEVVTGQAISLDSETTLTSGDVVSAILNGTDNVLGSIVEPRKTIALSELEGVKFNPELRFQNIITTDFVADDTTLSGAPLLTKGGDVAGMMIRLGSAQLIAIPLAEILTALKQLQQVANSDPIRDHGLSTDSIEARTDGRFGILKIIESTSLADAVTKFNLLAKEHPLGLTQPGLTVEEMTAAFRLWIASDECTEATRKDFQQVLDTQMLRPGHILQFDTKFETDSHLFEVWSIQFGDDKSYAWFKIRDTRLLSRLKTDEERKAWEQRIDQMKKSFHEYKRWGDRPKAYDTNPADSEPKDATKDSAVTVPPMEFDTLEDFLKPGRELFDKEMKQIDERLAKVVEGSAEHSLLTTKKKQLQQQWDLSVAQVKGMAAAAKAGKPVQLAPIVIPNNSRPWQAPMPDPLLGHDEDIAKVLAGTWQVKRFVVDREDMPFQFEGSTVNFSKNMMIIRLKSGDMKDERQMVYRIGHDKIDVWDLDSGHETACPYLGSYSIENDTLRICHHETRMELETPQSRPPVQPGKGFIYLELQRVPIAEFGLMVDDKNSAKSSSHSNETRIDTNSVEWPPSGFELTEQQIQRVIGAQSARIVRALDTPVDLVVDGKSSLAEIVSGIVREHRIFVRLNEKSFEEQGVAIHHVPAFEVHGVTLKSALTALLEKLLQHRSIPPVIEVRHGVLTLAAKAPSDTTNDLARSKPTSVVFQSMGPDKQALPETVVEVQGSDGVYYVLSDQNGLAPVVGHGVSNWYTTARDASGQLMAYTSHGMFLSKPTKPYVLNFTAPQLLTVNVSDEHSRPIEGATVGILAERCRYQVTDALGRAEFTLPVNNQYVQAIFALKSGKGLDYISYQPQWATDLPPELSLQLDGARELKVRLLDEQNQPLKGVPIYPVKFDLLNTEEPKAEKSLSWWKLAMGAVDWSATNEQGEVVIDWLPRNHAISFLTTNRELEHNTLNVTNPAEDIVEFRMTGPVKVSGRVLDIDGKPVAGASIAANNESGASANTDEEGRYVLKVRPGSTFYLEAVDSAGGGWMAKRRGISDWVEAVAGQPSKNNDVVIRPTARVFGRVTYTFDSAPAANIQLSYEFDGPEGRDPIKLNDHAVQSRGYGINGYTDDDGRFEFYAVPGKYTVSAVPDGGRRAVREFTVVAAEPHEANMAISKNIPVKGRVIAGDPPMPMGRITIKRKHLTDPFNLSGYDWSINEAGELDVDIRDRDPMILWGHSEDKQLWGITDMAWDDAEFEMKLAPRAEMKVRILDSDQKPVANTEFTYGIFRRIQPQYQKEEHRRETNVHSIEPREGTTDENGILKLQDLIAGGDYMIHRTASHFRFEENPDSPIAQAKILVDSMAKDVVVDIILMNIGLDIRIPE